MGETSIVRKPESGRLLNALTVDVEEYFQVSAFSEVVLRENWDDLPSRVVDSTHRLLDLFDETAVKATFFVLGWVADRQPALIRKIAEHGHELASHGYSHRLYNDQRPTEFRSELQRSRSTLQDISGQEVRGHRAASFSIGRNNLWALDVIAETGFEYDSSLFPVVHDRYGIPGAPRHFYRLRTPGGATLIEAPPSTLALGRVVLPVAGGGYFRIYPAALTHWAIERLNRKMHVPVVLYLHPWEIDAAQPRIDGLSWLTRIRHYTNLGRTFERLRECLARYHFGPLSEVIDRAGELPHASY